MSVNGLQLYKTKWNSGFTKQNHLSRAFLTEPEVISTIVHRIFGMQGQNPLQYLTSGIGRSKESGNREYDWFLQGDDEKAIKIVGVLAGANAGLNKQSFQVLLEEKWFANQDVLVFDNREYRARVMEDPFHNGQ